MQIQQTIRLSKNMVLTYQQNEQIIELVTTFLKIQKGGKKIECQRKHK